MGALRLFVAVLGAVAAGWVLLSAIRTVVLPRSADVALTHAVFVTTRAVFRALAKRCRSYEDRDRIMALDAPVALMSLAGAWALGIILAFGAVFWGLGVDPLRQAVRHQRLVVHHARLRAAPRRPHRPRRGRPRRCSGSASSPCSSRTCRRSTARSSAGS